MPPPPGRVLLYWRKPSLTPNSVKAARVGTIAEVAAMACALTVADFLRSIVARRRRAETLTRLRGPLLLRRWTLADPPSGRRNAFYTALREAAAARPWNHRLAEFPAEVAVELSLSTVEEAAAEAAARGGEGWNLVPHADAVAANGYRALRPRHGLDELRRASARGSVLTADGGAPAPAAVEVVVRFVDGANAWRGEWVADLREWAWSGWQVRSRLATLYAAGPALNMRRECSPCFRLSFRLHLGRLRPDHIQRRR